METSLEGQEDRRSLLNPSLICYNAVRWKSSVARVIGFLGEEEGGKSGFNAAWIEALGIKHGFSYFPGRT